MEHITDAEIIEVVNGAQAAAKRDGENWCLYVDAALEEIGADLMPTPVPCRDANFIARLADGRGVYWHELNQSAAIR